MSFLRAGKYIICSWSDYAARASALDFKDAATSRFGHGDVIFIYLEKHVFAFNHPL